MDPKHRRIIKDQRENLVEKVSLNNELISYFREYKMFNKYMWKDIESMSDLLDLLPYRGPHAFKNFIAILRKTGHDAEAELLESLSSCGDATQDLYYKMSSKPLGYCLIINNVKFEGPLKFEYREGSDKDEESLKTFFKEIGFDVDVKRNLKSTEEMLSCIKSFAKKDFSDVDSMILIILSHGDLRNDHDIIYGCDQEYLYKEDIYCLFANKATKGLHNKPKIFFFVACRGENADIGVKTSDAVVKKFTGKKESADSSIIVSTLSDAFIVHSTLRHHVSIRQHENGSYFCQALISVLKKYHKVHDLNTIIKLVNEELVEIKPEEFQTVPPAHVEEMGTRKQVMLCRQA